MLPFKTSYNNIARIRKLENRVEGLEEQIKVLKDENEQLKRELEIEKLPKNGR